MSPFNSSKYILSTDKVAGPEDKMNGRGQSPAIVELTFPEGDTQINGCQALSLVLSHVALTNTSTTIHQGYRRFTVEQTN